MQSIVPATLLTEAISHHLGINGFEVLYLLGNEWETTIDPGVLSVYLNSDERAVVVYPTDESFDCLSGSRV